MFKQWTRVIRALTQADAAREARAAVWRSDRGMEPPAPSPAPGDVDATYMARLEELHMAVSDFDNADNMARVAAWIVRSRPDRS